MTTEAPRKRGRPRKVVAITEPDVTITESTLSKTTTRTISSKAKVSKTTSKAPKTPAKKTVKRSVPEPSPENISEVIQETIPEPEKINDAPFEAELAEIAAQAPTVEPTAVVEPPSQPTPVTPATSKILKEVNAARAAAAEPVLEQAVEAVETSPAPIASSEATHPPSKLVHPPVSQIHAAKQTESPAPLRPPQASRPLPRSDLLEGLRKQSIAQATPAAAKTSALTHPQLPRSGPIGSVSGASSSTSDGGMPKNYKATSRRVLAIMVGLPLVIVTSYELYQRLVLKKERTPLLDAAVKPLREVPGKVEDTKDS